MPSSLDRHVTSDATARAPAVELLADAGRLARALGPDEAMAELARIVVPALADWCVIYARDGNELRARQRSHASAADRPRLAALRASMKPWSGPGNPLADAIRDCRPSLQRFAAPRLLAPLLDDRAVLAGEDLGAASVMTVPLAARGRDLGLLVLAAGPGNRFAPDDLTIAIELAHRAAIAIDNGRLYTDAKSSYDRLLSLFAQAPAAIAILRGPQHLIAFANPTARGLACIDTIGEPLREAVPGLPAEALAALDRVLAGERFVAADVPLAFDRDHAGQLDDRFFNVTIEPMRGPGGTIEGVLLFAFEVTEQVRERLLRKTITDSMDSALFMTDREGRCVFMNPAAEALTGCTFDELRGRAPFDRDFSGDVQTRGETMLQPKHGEPIPIAFTASPIVERDAAVGTVIEARDVTEQRQAERERLDLLDRERIARMEAEAANRSKDEFLAMLGHELRNPLSPILTALQLMQIRLGDAAVKERTIIQRQVDHLVRLVDDLLDISRITRGRIELKQRPLELAEVVAKAIEMASPLLEQRKHTLTARIAASGLPVNGDDHRLAQVVGNLLMNAAKYTEPGGRIEIAAEAAGGEVELRVCDTGIGIPADLLPRLFGEFVQGERTLDRSQGGLGLGLAIARSLVSMHGGTIAAHSEGVGRGSQFVVTLPLRDPVASVRNPTPPPSSPEPSALSTPRRILVVDDNRDAAHVLAEALAEAGHTTTAAFDGPSALRVAPDFLPEVALVDIGLPVMDGYELARRLRELPGLAELRLVAVTGYGQRSDREQSRRAGFDEHLVKPVGLRELEPVVARLWNSP